MDRACHDHLQRILAIAESGAAVEDEHLGACPACRAALARRMRQIEAVRGLARVAAPAALDGHVVAATHAGQRQERAIRALRSLGRLRAPAGLAQRMNALPAPAVLDRLVSEELADLSKATSRRFLARLAPLRAPDELRRRVLAWRDAPRIPRAALGIFAAALLLAIGALVFVQRDRQGTGARGPEGPRTVLVLQRVDSIRDLDPVAGQLLAGVSGGFVDAQRLHREGL